MKFLEKNCCITHQDKQFCSGGALINEKHAIAYLSGEIDKPRSLRITSWHGMVLSNEVCILNKLIVYNGIYSNYLYYLRFKIGDIVYSGTTLGAGMMVRAKATKLKSVWS